MTVKKGSRVKYKIGKGHALGRVSAIRGDKAVITTGSGAEVTRSLSGLKHPDDKDEPEPPATVPTLAENPAGHDTVARWEPVLYGDAGDELYVAPQVLNSSQVDEYDIDPEYDIDQEEDYDSDE